MQTFPEKKGETEEDKLNYIFQNESDLLDLKSEGKTYGVRSSLRKGEPSVKIV